MRFLLAALVNAWMFLASFSYDDLHTYRRNYASSGTSNPCKLALLCAVYNCWPWNVANSATVIQQVGNSRPHCRKFKISAISIS